jgi:hypothetical protein
MPERGHAINDLVDQIQDLRAALAAATARAERLEAECRAARDYDADRGNENVGEIGFTISTEKMRALCTTRLAVDAAHDLDGEKPDA